MSKVILLAGQKGGVGKSTIATNIATIAACSGTEVMVVDGDKQQSTKRFFDDRRILYPKLPMPLCTSSEGSGTGRLIDSLADKYSLIVVDLGGGDSETLRSALNADSINKVWLPTQPSGPDIRTLPFMAELVDQYSRINRPLKSKVIINKAETNPKITALKGSMEYLEGIEKISITKTILRERVVYKYAMVKGLCAPEFQAINWFETKNKRDLKAGKEMISLFMEITEGNENIDITKFSAYLDMIITKGAE